MIVTAVIGLLYIYIIGTPLKAVVDGLTGWLQGMKGANSVLLAAILGAMMAFDMGGPVNKVAYTFGMGCYAQGVYAPSTAMLLAIAIPPFIMFVATLFDKSLYSKEEIENGRTAAIMGIFGITEGAIPFALADPLRVIPSIMVGTAVSCALNAAFGVTQKNCIDYFNGPSICFKHYLIYCFNCCWCVSWCCNGKCFKEIYSPQR